MKAHAAFPKIAEWGRPSNMCQDQQPHLPTPYLLEAAFFSCTAFCTTLVNWTWP